MEVRQSRRLNNERMWRMRRMMRGLDEVREEKFLAATAKFQAIAVMGACKKHIFGLCESIQRPAAILREEGAIVSFPCVYRLVGIAVGRVDAVVAVAAKVGVHALAAFERIIARVAEELICAIA